MVKIKIFLLLALFLTSASCLFEKNRSIDSVSLSDSTSVLEFETLNSQPYVIDTFPHFKDNPSVKFYIGDLMLNFIEYKAYSVFDTIHLAISVKGRSYIQLFSERDTMEFFCDMPEKLPIAIIDNNFVYRINNELCFSEARIIDSLFCVDCYQYACFYPKW